VSQVVGIDTSSRGFHAVLTEAEHSYFWIREHRGDTQRRRESTFREAAHLFEMLPDGSIVVIEEPIILQRNPDTTLKLTMMAGVIEAAFWQACPDATLFWVNVSTWRRAVLNPAKGEAPRDKKGWKALARQHVIDSGVYSEAQLVAMEAEPDLWDAACIMEYGQQLVAEKQTAC
jgi:hypothetical protein